MMSVLDHVAGDIETVLEKEMASITEPVEKLKILLCIVQYRAINKNIIR